MDEAHAATAADLDPAALRRWRRSCGPPAELRRRRRDHTPRGPTPSGDARPALGGRLNRPSSGRRRGRRRPQRRQLRHSSSTLARPHHEHALPGPIRASRSRSSATRAPAAPEQASRRRLASAPADRSPRRGGRPSQTAETGAGTSYVRNHAGGRRWSRCRERLDGRRSARSSPPARRADRRCRAPVRQLIGAVAVGPASASSLRAPPRRPRASSRPRCLANASSSPGGRIARRCATAGAARRGNPPPSERRAASERRHDRDRRCDGAQASRAERSARAALAAAARQRRSPGRSRRGSASRPRPRSPTRWRACAILGRARRPRRQERPARWLPALLVAGRQLRRPLPPLRLEVVLALDARFRKYFRTGPYVNRVARAAAIPSRSTAMNGM